MYKNKYDQGTNTINEWTNRVTEKVQCLGLDVLAAIQCTDFLRELCTDRFFMNLELKLYLEHICKFVSCVNKMSVINNMVSLVQNKLYYIYIYNIV